MNSELNCGTNACGPRALLRSVHKPSTTAPHASPPPPPPPVCITHSPPAAALWCSTLRRKGMAERCRECRFAGDQSCLSTTFLCVLSAKEQTMSSGVQCTDECVTKFNELKLKVVAAPSHYNRSPLHSTPWSFSNLFLSQAHASSFAAHLPLPHLQD